MKTVHIDASRSYDVRIGRGLLDDCGRQIAERVRSASAAASRRNRKRNAIRCARC